MVTFWDGVSRPSSLLIHRIMGFWSRWPDHRKESEACYQAYPGGDVLDVGSHDGWYACLLAPKLNGTMVLIEPDSCHQASLHSVLASLYRTFPEKTFVLIPRPCSDSPSVHLARIGAHIAASTRTDGIGISAVSLDEITSTLKLSPAFVKVDVEGHELAVLRSGQQMINRYRPVLMVEMHSPELRTLTNRWLQTFGYCEHPIFTENGNTRALFSTGPT